MAKEEIFRGIDLADSEFNYESNGFRFHFSSEKKLDRYIERLPKAKRDMRNKFASQYRIRVDLDNYAEFALYGIIEKDCHIVDIESGGVIEWLGDITLIGVIKMLKNYKG